MGKIIVKPFMRSTAALLASMIFIAPALHAQTSARPPALAAPQSAITAETRSIDLGKDLTNRLTLPVHISGEGPYPFIIDTGSMRTILSTELAQRLALPARDPVSIISVTGPAILASVAIPELRFGREQVERVDALTIARENLGGVGLIGLDSLKDKRVTMDFRRRQLDVADSVSRRRETYDPDVIVVRARSKLGQLILVDSKVDGQRVNVILDTGAQMSIGNMALFRKMKLERLLVPPRPVNLVSVTGDQIVAQFTAVKRITVGSLTLTNVPMVFVDAAPFNELGLGERPAMLLGMEMLQMFDRIAIDFGRREVNFELPRSDRAPNDRQMLASR